MAYSPRAKKAATRQHGPELFDLYSQDYESSLDHALAPSGESAPYFARRRVEYLQNQLQIIGATASSVLDYGCGTGGSIPFLKAILRPGRLLGVDVSSASLLQARQKNPVSGVEFADCREFAAQSEFDLAFCNGVFHHIAAAARPAALRYIHDSLVPGGLFAFWENNPWNPATTYIMGRCEFDQGAIPINPKRAAILLGSNGFRVIHSSSAFYFPRWLKWLRPLEPALARLPLGTQYLILASKSSTPA